MYPMVTVILIIFGVTIIAGLCIISYGDEFERTFQVNSFHWTYLISVN